MQNLENEEKGITLIALVITIIVLLILAGVSIATLTGENGILTQAQNAKKETEDAAIDEQNKLNEYENFITGDVTKTTDTTPGVLDGEGTTDNPYKIESVEDLVAFFKDIVDGNEFEGNIIELTNTLDLTSANSYVDVNSTAFGDYNGDGNVTGIFDEINNKNYTGLKLANDIFKGTLDGQGNEIRNIYTNLYNQNAELGFIGVCKGTIKDISISGEYKIYYTDDYYRIGAITGINQGQLINCINNVKLSWDLDNSDVVGDCKIGSIAGINEGKITNCINNSKLEIKLTNISQNIEETLMYIGGMTGQNYSAGTINNCKNNGNIDIELSFDLKDSSYYKINRIGGLVGSNEGKIINSLNYSAINVKDTRLGESNTQEIKLGGIVGINNKSSSVSEITNVINYGKISGSTDDEINIGGIAGENEEGIPKIQNAYNKGVIEGTSNIDDGLKIGGIVGNAESTINRVYNTGNIISNSITHYIGGIIGDLHSSVVISKSKYLSTTATGAAQEEELEGVERVDSLTNEEIKELLNQGVKELNETTNELIEWQNIE